jgi:hypothetical protein
MEEDSPSHRLTEVLRMIFEDAHATAELITDRRITERRGSVDSRSLLNSTFQKKERPTGEQPVGERREKVERRRQIDPTTCERDYSDQEVEFMNAMNDYKRRSGRQFPTWSEVLEVMRSLGYRQTEEHTTIEM